jgi:transcriptional regulator with XRE-family HTH domain
MNIHQVFCKNLALIRSDRGLTQQAMADRLKINLQSYQLLEYGWKNGTDWPRPERIQKLAKALKCKPTDFFKEL